MKHRNTAAVLLAALMASTVVVGCSSTPTQQSAGQAVDDGVVTAKVKAALVADPVTKAHQINVETFKGTVQLSGFVETDEARTRALQLARDVEGVKKVKDAHGSATTAADRCARAGFSHSLKAGDASRPPFCLCLFHCVAKSAISIPCIRCCARFTPRASVRTSFNITINEEWHRWPTKTSSSRNSPAWRSRQLLRSCSRPPAVGRECCGRSESEV